jgi:hypothetical protein
MLLKHRLTGLTAAMMMLGLLLRCSAGYAADSSPIPDTYFIPLPMEHGSEAEFGNVEVIRGSVCDSRNNITCIARSSRQKGKAAAAFSDKIRIRGIFTNFDPIVEGVSCNDPDELADNFLNSGGSTFLLGVLNGGIADGVGNCVPAGDTGITFSLVWTPSGRGNVAVPVGGAAFWSDSNGNSGSAQAIGKMTLLGTGVGDCGTWAMDITFSNVSASSLGGDKSPVNIQMDYGSEISVPGSTSFGCLVTSLDVESKSFD